MSMKNELEDRMKLHYESVQKIKLCRRIPAIIRLDMRAGHSFTKNFKRPYDEVFHEAMNNTMQYLCENIQGCKLGYTQSDEITLLLTDYDTPTTDAWFGYSVQKMCSISASMATMKFNQVFSKILFDTICNDVDYKLGRIGKVNEKWENHSKSAEKGAMFDSRCFSVPKDEIVNCFIWRQQDATRNAIQMLGQTHFSHKQLENKSCNDIQEMLMGIKGINFNDMPVEFKRGVCCVRRPVEILVEDGIITRNKWVIDKEIPIFTQDRNYIESVLRCASERTEGLPQK